MQTLRINVKSKININLEQMNIFIRQTRQWDRQRTDYKHKEK